MEDKVRRPKLALLSYRFVGANSRFRGRRNRFEEKPHKVLVGERHAEDVNAIDLIASGMQKSREEKQQKSVNRRLLRMSYHKASGIFCPGRRVGVAGLEENDLA